MPGFVWALLASTSRSTPADPCVVPFYYHCLLKHCTYKVVLEDLAFFRVKLMPVDGRTSDVNFALHTLFLPRYKTGSLYFMYYAGTLEKALSSYLYP